MQHLAMIMDGNRRWAKTRSFNALKGHTQGAQALKIAVSFCLENKIPYLSLYTFSLENFNRSEEEKNHLFNLLSDSLEKNLNDFIKNEIRVRFIGDRSYFPSQTKSAISKVEKATENFTNLNLSFLFCYGAKQEILHAVKNIASQVKNNSLNIDEITDETIQKNLWTNELPNPDLIIRTGGDVRLSNFLLYQSAYSEFIFLNYMWPEISKEILNDCLVKFNNIKRNFGS